MNVCCTGQRAAEYNDEVMVVQKPLMEEIKGIALEQAHSDEHVNGKDLPILGEELAAASLIVESVVPIKVPSTENVAAGKLQRVKYT